MGIFKADPGKQFEKDAAAQRKLRADHVSELAKHQTAHSEADAKVARLLDAGAGQEDIEAAQADRSKADAAIVDRTKAIARADAKLAEIAAGLAKHELGKQQEAYAVEAERRVSVLEERTQALLASITEWIPAAEDVAEICVDAAGLPPYGRNSLAELPPAVAMVAEAVRGRIIPDVLHGDKPPVIAAKPTLVPPKPEPEPRTAWLALQPVRYEHNGPQLLNRYAIVTLTASQSRMGLEGFEQKVICALDDERVPALRGRLTTQQRPSEFAVYDLDTGAVPQGLVTMKLPSKATYHLPSTFKPTNTSDVQLPKVAARKSEDTEK